MPRNRKSPVTCFICDASLDEVADAKEAGWEEVEKDDGPSWNYLGFCFDCLPPKKTVPISLFDVFK